MLQNDSTLNAEDGKIAKVQCQAAYPLHPDLDQLYSVGKTDFVMFQIVLKLFALNDLMQPCSVSRIAAKLNKNNRKVSI